MANAVAMVINDGQTTPVAVTFTPTYKDPQGVYWFRDLLETNPLLSRKISVSIKLPTRGQKEPLFKVVLRVLVPTPDITAPTTGTGIQPAPSVAYTSMGELTFMLPQRSTLQNRRDVEAFFRNGLANTQIQALIRNFEMPT